MVDLEVLLKELRRKLLIPNMIDHMTTDQRYRMMRDFVSNKEKLLQFHPAQQYIWFFLQLLSSYEDVKTFEFEFENKDQSILVICRVDFEPNVNAFVGALASGAIMEKMKRMNRHLIDVRLLDEGDVYSFEDLMRRAYGEFAQNN